ncbi:MAG: hypothetical protein JSV20_08410 [Candidatus Bathyarchaeota archaeon]|nr:MAG: hypothetical protein JSV20_08410 [Candidatus Bathyarchaeota archaeon]
MPFIEGDFIETTEGMIFDVKGTVHPPEKAIAFIRYISDPSGDRQKNKQKYRKIYALSERYEFLRKNYPEYLQYDEVFDEVLSMVPLHKLFFHYKPVQKTIELSGKTCLKEEEDQTFKFIKTLQESANVSIDKIGVTGSILVGLSSRSSDIDVIVYGTKNCRNVHTALKCFLLKGKVIQRLPNDAIVTRYKKRCKGTDVSFDQYVFHEVRKSFQGYFMGREFFMRYVRDYDEIKTVYGETRYTTLGYAKIKGLITDDSDAIFTPCKYMLRKAETISGKDYGPIEEIVSLRGRFSEQAKEDEEIIAQGKIERVATKGHCHNRLLLGNYTTDFMVSKSTNR